MDYDALHPLDGWAGLVMQVVRIGERLFAVGGLGADGQIVVSDNDGRTWTKTTWSGTKGRAAWKSAMQPYQQHGLRQLWGWSARELTAVGEYGSIVTSLDGGATWQQEGFKPTGCLFGVHGRGEHLYVAGDDGIWKRKRKKTVKWERVDETRNLCRIWPVGDDLIVVGDGGTILRVPPDDIAETLRSGTRDDLFGFLAIDVKRWIVVGKRGLVLASDDAGASFERIPCEAEHDLFAAVKLHDELFAVVGHKGTVMLSPSGRRWQMQAKPKAQIDLRGAWSAGDGSMFIAGGEGHAWRATLGA